MLAESKGRDELSHLKDSHEKKKHSEEEVAKQAQKKCCAPYKPTAEVVYEEETVVDEEEVATYWVQYLVNIHLICTWLDFYSCA